LATSPEFAPERRRACAVPRKTAAHSLVPCRCIRDDHDLAHPPDDHSLFDATDDHKPADTTKDYKPADTTEDQKLADTTEGHELADTTEGHELADTTELIGNIRDKDRGRPLVKTFFSLSSNAAR
jgi:hypothetical protein